MIKGNTGNFFVTDLDYMESHPNKRANVIGRKVPYHLQYVRDGNVNVKPKEEDRTLEDTE